MINKQGNILVIVLIIIALVGAAALTINRLNQTNSSNDTDGKPTPTIKPTTAATGVTNTLSVTPTPTNENNLDTPTPATSNSNSQTDFVPFEIPVKYWAHDTEPGANIQLDAPMSSNIVTDDSTVPVLQFPDGSKLTFTFSHAALEAELNENEITPINTSNYDSTYRYMHNGDMTYAYVKTETTCDGNGNTTLNPPCGAPVFHGMVITCADPNSNYSTCDQVMETISGLDPHY